MAGSASGIRAGMAYVELGAYTNPLEKGLEKGAKLVKSWGRSLAVLGATLTAAGGAGIAFFGHAISQWVEGGTALYELSKRTGATVESLSTLGYASERNGVSVEALGMAFRKMSKLISDAQDGTGKAGEAIEHLGLNLDQLNDMTIEDKFRAIGNAIGAIEAPTRRAALAQQFFGRTGTQLLPLFSEGAEGLAALEGRAKDLRLEMSGESAKAAHDFGNLWKDLTAVWKKSVSVIGASLAPELVNVITYLTDLGVKVIDYLRANREMIVVAAQTAVGLTALGVVITGLAAVVTAFGITLGAVATIVGVVGAAIGFLVSPLGATLAALVLLDAGTHDYGAGVQAVLDLAVGQWKELKKTAIDTWEGIRIALSKGDFKGALEVGFKGLQVAFRSIMVDILGIWYNFVAEVDKTWNKTINDLMAAWVRFAKPYREGTREEAAAYEANTIAHSRYVDALRDKRMKDLDQELRKAKEDLDFTVRKVGVGGFEAEHVRKPLHAIGPPPEVWEAVDNLAKAFVGAGTRGTFNPFAAGALASTDPAKETAANTKKANKHLEEIKKELEDLNEFGP